MADDPYAWAQRNGIYMEQEELAALLRDPHTFARTLVVDTRDDDRAGGHIAGSLHCADGRFDAAAVHAAAEGGGAEKVPPAATRVVFHCMESVRRGPRCAQRLKRHLMAHGLMPRYRICVLKGGADQWLRRFHADAALVHGFNNEFWGFYPLEDEGEGECAGEGAGEGGMAVTKREGQRRVAAPLHALYERPRDQVATPWSEGGSEAALAADSSVTVGGDVSTGSHGQARPCSPPQAAQFHADVLAQPAERVVGVVGQVTAVEVGGAFAAASGAKSAAAGADAAAAAAGASVAGPTDSGSSFPAWPSAGTAEEAEAEAAFRAMLPPGATELGDGLGIFVAEAEFT